MIDYLNELREGVLEAFTGIVQGLKGDGNAPSPDVQLLEPHVLFIVQFITLVAQDTDHSDGNVAASAGLVGWVNSDISVKCVVFCAEYVINDCPF